MYERYTDRARKVLILASEDAGATRAPFIDSVHLLWGLLKEDEGIAAKVLVHCGVTFQDIVELHTPTGEQHWGGLPLSTSVKKAQEQALRQALEFGNPYIGTEHLLLGMTRVHENDDLWKQLNVSVDDIRQAVYLAMRGEPLTPLNEPILSKKAVIDVLKAQIPQRRATDDWMDDLLLGFAESLIDVLCRKIRDMEES